MEAKSSVKAGEANRPIQSEVEDLEMWVKKVASTSKTVEVTLQKETEDLDEEGLAQVKSLLSMHQSPVSVSIYPAS